MVSEHSQGRRRVSAIGSEPRTLTEARARAIVALRRMNVDIKPNAITRVVAARLSIRGFTRRQRESVTDYFNRFAEKHAPREKFEPWPFKELKLTPHPRQAEIDALPSQITMHGVGNGREDHTQFIRGAGRGS